MIGRRRHPIITLGLVTAFLCSLFAISACSPKSTSESPSLISQEEADRIVSERFPAGRYVINDFIPKPGAPPPHPLATPRKLRIGLQWLMTGDVAPWVVAQKKGFFSELGLDVELTEGGPGRDMLGGLVGGRFDIYMGAPEVAISMITSPTGADLKMIGASMKSTGAGWLGLDRSIPSSQKSDKRITADDFRGHRIGVQPGDEFMLRYACDKMGIAMDEITIINQGGSADPLVGGALDFLQGLRSDQPRLLERQGIHNWTFLSLEDLGYPGYLDVSVVTDDFYRQEPQVLACYIAALDKSIRYVAAHPEEAAQITVAAIPTDPGSVSEMENRLHQEIPCYLGDGSEPLLAMNEAKVRALVSILYRFHRIDLPVKS